MPLSKGCTPRSRSKNIARLIREGKPRAQAAAIAYSVQRQHCACRITPRGTTTCRSKRKGR
jgi:hypothetical protein